MWKVSHAAIITFLVVCTALMVTLLLAQDADEGYTYEQEEETWS